MTNDSTPPAPLDLDALRAMAGVAFGDDTFTSSHGADTEAHRRQRDKAASVLAARAALKAAVPALVDEVQALRDRCAAEDIVMADAPDDLRAMWEEALAEVLGGTPDGEAARRQYESRLTAAERERDVLRDRLRDAEAQRDALLAIIHETFVAECDGDYDVRLRAFLTTTPPKWFTVESHPTREAAERAAAAWQQLIDQARAGAAAKGSE